MVLLVALVPTLVVFWRMREVAHERDEAQFRAAAVEIEESLRDDFDELATELNSLAAFFEASFSVPKARWTLLIQKTPGPVVGNFFN